MSTISVRPFTSNECGRMGLGIVGRVFDARADIVNIIDRILSNPQISRIASSPSAARKVHEMMTAILDRIASHRRVQDVALNQLQIELANAVVLAKYQANRRLIHSCYADIVEYVVRELSTMLRRRDPSLPLMARRVRLVFDALIVGIAGKK